IDISEASVCPGHNAVHINSVFDQGYDAMEDIRRLIPANSPRLMDRLRLFMRSKHLAYKTEKTYCHWILAFIRFHQKKHPESMGATEVDAFLSHLACQKNVAA